MQLLEQLCRFGVIGGTAFLVHWSSVILLVSRFDISPHSANIAGFLLAFSISYFGHCHWTFAQDSKVCRKSLQRFSVVSMAGFIVNESIYALLLSLTSLHYSLSLIVALLLAALSTFYLSREWAFVIRE